MPANHQIDKERYYPEREFALNAEHEQQEFLDKTLLSLSGGALAVSLSFLKDFVPHPTQRETYMLGGAWFFLVACIVFVLGSTQISQVALRRYVSDWDNAVSASAAGVHFSSGARKATNVMNWAAIFCGIFGLILITLVGWYNLPLANQSGKQTMQKTTRMDIQKGFVVQTPPVQQGDRGFVVQRPPVQPTNTPTGGSSSSTSSSGSNQTPSDGSK